MKASDLKAWKREIDSAKTICEPLGCAVEPSPHDYEIATVKGEGVSLIIYPHTVKSTRNQHARVRDNGSRDKAKARAVLTALENGDGLPEDTRWRVAHTCTFTCKNMPA